MQLTDTEIALIVQLVFPAVVSVCAWLFHVLVSKLPANQQPRIEAIVNQAVQAVEQARSLVPGAVKKEYATNLTNALLKAVGLKATPAQVDTLIEAAVYQFNVNRPKTGVIPTVRKERSPHLDAGRGFFLF